MDHHEALVGEAELPVELDVALSTEKIYHLAVLLPADDLQHLDDCLAVAFASH